MKHAYDLTTMKETYVHLGKALLRAPKVEVPTWQGQDVKGSNWGATYELQNVVFEAPVAGSVREAQISTQCNMPWAEEHFQERVSGVPYNPPPSAANWPFAKNEHKAVTDHEHKFSHTYPERFWPKYAGTIMGNGFSTPIDPHEEGVHRGIRFRYGDLGDVVKLLAKDPTTRQAYLPVFFPEDTGAHHGERIPCTLGYHFMIRNNKLSITYFIRSCDFLRHFPDDVYFAMRLAQWVRDQLTYENKGVACPISDDAMIHVRKDPLGLGTLTMHMCSLHVFGGDRAIMEHRYGS